jgi:MoaA/NifB/PqqE/SkfB family radical SAM enzyme
MSDHNHRDQTLRQGGGITLDVLIDRVAARTIGPTKIPVSRLKSEYYRLLNEGLARLFRTPQYLIVFVSDRCWMHCAHCWFNEDWKHEHLTQPPLRFEEYEKVAASTERITHLSITGGEAFLRDDLVELATMFRKSTQLVRYQIPTSGYMTGRIVDMAERCLQANPDTLFEVDVSIDGVEETHNDIRRSRDSFERATATVKELHNLRRHYAHFDVGIITTISRRNQHQIRDIAALIDTIHPNGEWAINIARGNGRDPHAIEVDPNAYRLAHELVDKRIAQGRCYKGKIAGTPFSQKWLSAKNAVRREVIYDIITTERPGGGCAAGSLGGVLYSDGALKVCEMLDDDLGNVRDFEYDLAKMWANEAAKKMRRQIQETGCQCTQECFLTVSIPTQINLWPRLIKKRLEIGR